MHIDPNKLYGNKTRWVRPLRVDQPSLLDFVVGLVPFHQATIRQLFRKPVLRNSQYTSVLKYRGNGKFYIIAVPFPNAFSSMNWSMLTGMSPSRSRICRVAAWLISFATCKQGHRDLGNRMTQIDWFFLYTNWDGSGDECYTIYALDSLRLV